MVILELFDYIPNNSFISVFEKCLLNSFINIIEIFIILYGYFRMVCKIVMNVFYWTTSQVLFKYLLYGYSKLLRRANILVFTIWSFHWTISQVLFKFTVLIFFADMTYVYNNSKCRYDLCLQQNILICMFVSWGFCVCEIDI